MNEKVVKSGLKKCESLWMSWDEGEGEASGVISPNFVLLLLLLLSTSSSLPQAPHLACSSTKDEWQLSQVKDFH